MSSPDANGQATRVVVVGRVGRAHGLRGEVSVEPRTDEPDRRFAAGARLACEADRPGVPDHLTVESARSHLGRLLVTFAGVRDRTAAERLHGVRLLAAVADDERPEDPEEFYDHQLVGLQARTTDGRPVGRVTEVRHSGAQDLLVLDRDGGEVLVPFVAQLVPEVDLDAGVLLVVDLPGLLDG